MLAFALQEKVGTAHGAICKVAYIAIRIIAVEEPEDYHGTKC